MKKIFVIGDVHHPKVIHLIQDLSENGIKVIIPSQNTILNISILCCTSDNLDQATWDLLNFDSNWSHKIIPCIFPGGEKPIFLKNKLSFIFNKRHRDTKRLLEVLNPLLVE